MWFLILHRKDFLGVFDEKKQLPETKIASLHLNMDGWNYFLVSFCQWLFLVPIKGGRWHIIPQLAVYTTDIFPSGG